MKFIVALVIAAIAMAAEGSIIPLLLSGPAILPAPAGLAIPGATIIQSNPAAIPIAIPAPAPIALDISSAPAAPALILAASAAAAPALTIAAPAPALAASSVSATRGSVHVAPLPGHAISQQQLNLAPAPGTA
uniref:Putative cuticle protein n=1 Tax=Psorophora albipes TaxID=869069 RepID=T1E2L6_9DIPT